MFQVVPYHLETMKFGSSMEDEDSDYLQLFFPLVVAHKIDASSPLFELSPKDLQAKQFEIILSLEGTTPETGNTIQVFYSRQLHVSAFLLKTIPMSLHLLVLLLF